MQKVRYQSQINQNFGTICHTEVCLTFSRLAVLGFAGECTVLSPDQYRQTNVLCWWDDNASLVVRNTSIVLPLLQTNKQGRRICYSISANCPLTPPGSAGSTYYLARLHTRTYNHRAAHLAIVEEEEGALWLWKRVPYKLA